MVDLSRIKIWKSKKTLEQEERDLELDVREKELEIRELDIERKTLELIIAALHANLKVANDIYKDSIK